MNTRPADQPLHAFHRGRMRLQLQMLRRSTDQHQRTMLRLIDSATPAYARHGR